MHDPASPVVLRNCSLKWEMLCTPAGCTAATVLFIPAIAIIEIDMDKLRMNFLALNVDFEGPSLDFLGSRKPAHEGIKKRYPRKSHYFTIVGQSFVKTVAWECCLSQQTLVTSFSVAYQHR